LPRNVLPWVLLVVAIVVAVTVLRPPAQQVAAPATSTVGPGASSVASGGSTASGSVPPASTYNDPPMSDPEKRDFHLRVGHEACEEGAKRINELEGNAPADPKGMRFVSACLRRGNIAWYKCILETKTRLEAGTCNRRFLNGAGSP
jgi:hypothetical protein